MQILFSYERTVRVLKWLTLALFAYVAVVLVVSVPWGRAIAESPRPWSFAPAGVTGKEYAAMVVAVLGTTISPYLFFWQATQEVEDGRRRPETQALRRHKAYASEHLSRIKQDTVVGMGVSNVVALSIFEIAWYAHKHGQLPRDYFQSWTTRMWEVAQEKSFRSMNDNPSMKIVHDEFDRFVRRLIAAPAPPR
jgi:Mn2+/Fe2+ NRAMP family transporter